MQLYRILMSLKVERKKGIQKNTTQNLLSITKFAIQKIYLENKNTKIDRGTELKDWQEIYKTKNKKRKKNLYKRYIQNQNHKNYTVYNKNTETRSSQNHTQEWRQRNYKTKKYCEKYQAQVLQIES